MTMKPLPKNARGQYYDARGGKLRVGQRVTTTWPKMRTASDAVSVTRTITAVRSGNYGSGWGVLLERRAPCECCGREYYDDSTTWLDASWVLP